MSAFQYTLADARQNSTIQEVVGVCKGGNQFREYVNEAIRLLMRRGGWVGLEVLMRLCAPSCFVTFPRHVGTVLGLRLCKTGQVEIRNHWWSIMRPGCGRWSQGLFPGYGYGWGYNGVYGGGYAPDSIDSNEAPIFNQVSGNTGKLIRYHVVKQQDYGKTITIYGKQYGGQPLQTEVDGAWINGITITAANPIAQTTTLVTKITSVVREATEGQTYLYEYDPATTKLRMLAVYEPSETNPSYRQMYIPLAGGAGCHVDENDQKIWQFEALVKLQHIPAVAENDFIQIANWDAIAMAIQSIKARRANDVALAEAHILSAVKELNYDLRDKSPDQQFAVSVNVLGSRRTISNIV